MLRVHASGLWKELARLSSKAKSQRLAAVAYFTSEENVKFKKKDVLIVDASDETVASGGTSAKLLASLLERGVKLYSVRGLHAKVYLFDQTAVIGSANLTNNSMNLIEAAVVTDRPDAVAGVSYLIESLRKHKSAKEIDQAFIKRVLSIPVSQRLNSKGPVGAADDSALVVPEPRTWLLGLFGLDEDQFPGEQTAIERGTRRAAKLLEIEEDDVDWIRYPHSWRIAQEAREGDNVVQIWRESRTDKSPEHVFRATPIVLRQEEETCVRLFLRPQEQRVSWKSFRKQWSALGYANAPGLNAERLVSAASAGILDALWD